VNAVSLRRQVAAPWLWAANARSRRSLGLHAAFWLALPLLPAAAALRWLPQPVAVVIVALLLGMALAGWWAVQFAALLRLDHPHFARLVPRHTAQLRATALGLWGVGTVLGGCGVAALLAWAAWPRLAVVLPGSLPIVLAAAGAALLLVALATRWPLLWVLVFLVPASGPLPQRLLAWAAPWWQAGPWLGCAAGLSMMAVALAASFGQGDTAHAAAWERRERWRRIAQAGLTGNKPTLAAYGRWGEWLGAPWQHLADGWLANVTRRARPDAASVMARAEVALNGTQHWVRQLGVLVPLLAGLVLLFGGLALALGPAQAGLIFQNGYFGMSIGLTSVVLGTVVGLPSALWCSRREQALVMLLPGVPQGAALNQALAWRQARQFAMVWGLTVPVFAAVAWFGGVPQVLVMPAVVLPALAWVWRNAAHQQEPSPSAAVLPFLLTLALGSGSMLLLRGKPEALLPVMAGLVGVAAVVLAWRWRQVSRWPQALPAGRAG
jgi:hypothetical protein